MLLFNDTTAIEGPKTRFNAMRKSWYLFGVHNTPFSEREDNVKHSSTFLVSTYYRLFCLFVIVVIVVLGVLVVVVAANFLSCTVLVLYFSFFTFFFGFMFFGRFGSMFDAEKKIERCVFSCLWFERKIASEWQKCEIYCAQLAQASRCALRLLLDYIGCSVCAQRA